MVCIYGSLLPGRAVQAVALREVLMTAAMRSRVAELLGLAVGGLFVSGLAAAASVLIASLAVTAAGKAWDGSPAGEEGTVARAARAVAAVSVSVPVVVAAYCLAACAPLEGRELPFRAAPSPVFTVRGVRSGQDVGHALDR